MNNSSKPTEIPAYAHPVPVGADGIRFRRVHGPRTEQATTRRTLAGLAYTTAIAARAKDDLFSPAEYVAVAR